MRKLILAISILALGSATAFADPIAERQDLMKERGKIVGALVKMVKGEQPFDATSALEALQQLEVNAERFDAAKLFPPGTEQGGDTEAAPSVWEDRAGFIAAEDAFLEHARAATAAPPADVDALKALVGQIGADCSSCHRAYRIKKG